MLACVEITYWWFCDNCMYYITGNYVEFMLQLTLHFGYKTLWNTCKI